VAQAATIVWWNERLVKFIPVYLPDVNILDGIDLGGGDCILVNSAHKTSALREGKRKMQPPAGHKGSENSYTRKFLLQKAVVVGVS